MAANPDGSAERVLSQLDRSATYAVRSSADEEDRARSSFAGRFRRMLDVPAERVPDAVLAVGLRAGGDGVESYAAAIGCRVPTPPST